MSFTLAAGNFPISTVADPIAIIPGPPGTHTGMLQGMVVSLIRAAGELPISTVISPLFIAMGNPG